MPAINFKPADYKEEEFKPLPKGWYTVRVISSEIKASTKPGKEGVHNLSITSEILDGENKGRKIFDNFCTVHPRSEIAEKIARQKLYKLGSAVDVPDFAHTEQLHMIPYRAYIDIKAGNDGYKDKNITVGWEKMGALAATNGIKKDDKVGVISEVPEHKEFNDALPF